jgi:anti-sigma factor ChrR (cupin superfamily)
MRSAEEVNANANKVAFMDTRTMAWEDTEWPGVQRKVLEFVNHPKMGRETSILKLAAGASLPTTTWAERLDFFVIEGACSDEQGSYGKHTFVRQPPGTTQTLRSDVGCTLYAKWRVPIHKEVARIVIDAMTAQWGEFPHRGADVLHLYPNKDGIETGRIGHVHTHRKLPSHDHSIGEETLVLEGVLKDEFASYEAGTWFRMPCGVAHAPYTEDLRCKMLIREGDLVW